jgi:hypothetical protein
MRGWTIYTDSGGQTYFFAGDQVRPVTVRSSGEIANGGMDASIGTT